jgi:hypothetical protein
MRRITLTEFFDSAKWGLIPAGADALLYIDGKYAASRQDAKRFRAVRWITVLGSANAGAGDFEEGNALFEASGRLREWAEARKVMGCRARVYTDLSNLKAACAQVGDCENVVWWLALYGEKLTAEKLATAGEPYGVTLDPAKIWAQQYAGGPSAPFDNDALIGAW